ncbi:MAG: hypothetical protein ACOYNS_09465 [Bacteroidota bacterium]
MHSSVSVSVARPSTPDYFYDYWKLGYGISYIQSRQTVETIGWMAIGEARWFALDQDRLFQRYNIDAGSTTMTGGSAVAISASASVTYRVPDYAGTVPYLFAGFGLSFSDIFGSTITYPFSTSERGMQSGLGCIFPLGMYIETKYRGTTDIVILAKYDYGIPISGQSLSGNASIGIGVRLD